MRSASLSVALAVLLASPGMAMAAVDSESAWNQKQGLDASFVDAAYPVDHVTWVRMPAIEAKAVSQLRADNASRGRAPLKLGLHRALDEQGLVLGSAQLNWHATSMGGLSARFAVSSQGAAALRLGLSLQGLPAGSELRFGSDSKQGGQAPALGYADIERMLRVDGRIWTPLTSGDTQWVELLLPAGQDPRWLSLKVDSVSHLLVDPSRRFDEAKINESQQPCMQDVKCEANPSAAFTAAKNAVASMVFEADGSSSVCTGTLLNDEDTSTQVPYFFSAAHCFTTQTVANTLTTLWFYEATACASRIEDSTTQQVAGGAQVLYGDAASDVLFLRLNGTPPNGSTFLGWDDSAISVGAPITVIHHPAGDAKKYSRGQVTSLGPSSLASGQFIQVAYSLAATEGGSSGSGLLTESGNGFRLRGGLLGGSSECSVSGTNSPDNSDDYSRFDLAFASLRQYLESDDSSNPPPSSTDYSGAWNNAAQDGWGLVVIRGSTSGAYGMYVYHYDQDSTPAWYLASGALSGSTFDQPIFGFTGPWFGISPFNPGQVQARAAGNLRVSFSSATTATIDFTIDGRQVQTSLNKLAF